MNEFVRGAVSVCCLLAGLYFLRFWRQSRDRLFLLFSLAFAIFALNWALLGLGAKVEHLYLVRLSAFLLIAAAVLDKNYRASR